MENKRIVLVKDAEEPEEIALVLLINSTDIENTRKAVEAAETVYLNTPDFDLYSDAVFTILDERGIEYKNIEPFEEM